MITRDQILQAHLTEQVPDLDPARVVAVLSDLVWLSDDELSQVLRTTQTRMITEGDLVLDTFDDKVAAQKLILQAAKTELDSADPVRTPSR